MCLISLQLTIVNKRTSKSYKLILFKVGEKSQHTPLHSHPIDDQQTSSKGNPLPRELHVNRQLIQQLLPTHLLSQMSLLSLKYALKMQ